MASSQRLRKNLNQHVIKNKKSKKMDSDISVAVKRVQKLLVSRYPKLRFEHVKTVKLIDIVDQLKKQYPAFADKFASVRETSFIRPDGGFLYAINQNGERRLILVPEVKRQGTNDARAKEGLSKQALGNAVERLGKNVVGLRAMFKSEGVFPFVCFGNGYDFRDETSIVDRVKTINDFFPLNEIFVVKQYLPFEPGSMFFRYKPWMIEEMKEIMLKIAIQAIEYRFV